MASAHSRSDTRGRPPPKRWVFTCSGSNGSNTAHNSSEMRNPVVVRLFGVRSRSRFLVACLFIPPILPRFSGYSDRHLEARFILRPRDPIERLVRDGVLSEKEAQLGRMFLHVTHGVQLELEKAHRLPPPPGESNLAARLLV